MESLEQPYIELQPEELVDAWASYTREPATIAVAGTFGALSLRPHIFESSKVASIDLCEVVRATHEGLADSLGIGPGSIEHYGEYFTTAGVERGEEKSLVIDVINSGKVQPVEGIDDIKKILRGWRAQNVLSIANTATFPQNEIATINFLGKHLLDCFDGIVFQRDGISKARSLEAAIQQRGVLSNAVERIVHIDDLPKHMITMHAFQRTHLERTYLGVTPRYKGHEYPEESPHFTLAKNPLDAFNIADRFLLDS